MTDCALKFFVGLYTTYNSYDVGTLACTYGHQRRHCHAEISMTGTLSTTVTIANRLRIAKIVTNSLLDNCNFVVTKRWPTM
jgi:hypothetical protein